MLGAPSPGADSTKQRERCLKEETEINRTKNGPPPVRAGTRPQHSTAVEKAPERAADEAMRVEGVSTFIRSIRKSGADEAQIRELTKQALASRLTAPRSIWGAAERLKKSLGAFWEKRRQMPEYQ